MKGVQFILKDGKISQLLTNKGNGLEGLLRVYRPLILHRYKYN